MDAITMLKNEHKAVEKLFKQFESAGDRAHVEKRRLVDKIIEELSLHAAVEEMLFYPVTREMVPETTDEVLESLEEHHIIEWTLSELQDMDPSDERFDAKVTVLIEHVRHHVKEEEGDYFRTVRDELGRSALAELGERMEAARAVAPTHPHPTSPDTAPANIVVGTAAGIVDRVGDTVSGLAQGSVTAVGDIVDRVRGTKSGRPAPTGTSTARSTAQKVRSSSEEAIDAAVAAVRRARDTGETAVQGTRRTGARTKASAKTAVKRTAGTARAVADQTVDEAETAVKRTVGTARQATSAAAKRTAGTARQAAESVADTAEAGVKQTVGTARQSAGATAKTAKRGAKRTATATKKKAAATKAS